jgi:hypothetical protein
VRARRVDANHGALVLALRQCGWTVVDTHRLPNFVDAVVCRAGCLRLVEFKTLTGQLTCSQRRLLEQGLPMYVLRTIGDCAALR